MRAKKSSGKQAVKKASAATHTSYSCHGCTLPINDTADFLQCDICEICVHPCCVGFTDSALETFKDIRDVTGWVCRECRKECGSKILKLQAAHASLAEEMVALKIVVDQLQANSATPSTPILYAEALKSAPVKLELQREVRTAIKDSDRRSRNVLISGLEETDGTADVEIVTIFFEQNLPVKPALAADSCKRVGKVVSGRPRKLLVTLRTATTATDVLKSAKELRKSSDPIIKNSVFINRDLSPEEAKAAYEMRVKKRAEKTNMSSSDSNSQPGTSSSSNN